MGNTPAKGYENSIGSRQKPVVSAGPEAHSPVPLRNDGRVAGDVERAVEEPKRRRVGSSSSTGSRYLQHATDRLSQGRKRNASGAPVFAGQDEHWSRKLERVSEGTWFDMELASHESNEAGTAHSAANDSAADLSRGVRGEDTASASTALAERDLESGAVSLDSCRVRAASTAPDLNDPCEHVRSPLVNSVVDDDGWRSAGSESRQEVDMLRNIKPCKDGKVCVIVASDAHDLTIASASAAAMFCSDAPGSVEQYDEFCQGEMHDTRCETESAETFEPRYSALASPRENLAAEIDADVKITVSSLVNKVCDVLNMGNDESTAARPDDATAEREGNAPVISSGEQAESNKPAAHLLTECAATGASSASESCGNAGESDRTSGEDVKIYPEDCATPDASDARVHESTPSKENLRQTGDTEMPHRKDSISGDVLIMGERSTSEEVKIALERIVDLVVSVTLATVTNANAADQASVQIAEEDTGDNAEQTKATDPIDTCSRKQLVCDTEQLIINCTGETNVHFTAPTVADSCKESEISDDSYGKQSAVKGEGTDSPQSDKNMEHILPDVVAVLEAVLETIDKMFSEEAATVIPVGADRTSTNTHTELLKHASERDSVEVSPTDVCNDQTVGDRPGSESWSAVYETDAADSCVIELIDQIVSDAVSAAGEGNDCFNKDADALSTITNVKGDTDELNSVEEQVDTSACAPAVVICSASFVAGETEASIAAAAARDTSAGAATDKLEESANTDSSSETYVAEAQCSDVLADATGPERNVLLGQKNSDFEGDFPENVDDERGSGETPLREINSVETAPSLGTEISRDPESVNGFDCATPGAELLSASLTCTTTVTKYDVNPEAGLVMENLLSRVEEVAGHDFTPVQLQGDECVTCPGAFDKTENQNADNSDFAPDPGESDVNQNPASLREETEHRQVVEQVLNKLISDVELHCEYQVRDAAIEQSIAVDERKAQDEPVGDDKTDVNIDSNFASDSESACTSSNTSETDESKGESFDLGDDDASSTKAETPESQSEGSLSFSPYDSLVAVSAESQADADEECAHPAGDGNSRSAREDSEIAEASTEEDQLAVNSCEEKMILKAKKLGEDWERDQRIAQKWNIKPQPDSQAASSGSSASYSGPAGLASSSKREFLSEPLVDGADATPENLKAALSEMEEKYRRAMLQIAQLDNERSQLQYQTQQLQDLMEEQEDELYRLKREHTKSCQEMEQQKRMYGALQKKFSYLEEMLRQRDELIQCLQSQQKDASKVMSEVFDLKETVIWKNKKIEALMRQVAFYKKHTSWESEQTEQGLVLVGDNGMRSADGGSDDEREPRPGLALVTPEAAQLLDPSTSLDAQLRQLAQEKQDLEDQVRHFQLQLEEERREHAQQLQEHSGHGSYSQNGLGEMQILEVQREANRQVNEYKMKLQKTEQDLAAFHGNMSRLESQLQRYKQTSELYEKNEDEMRAEKRKLMRDLRTALDRIEEMEMTNSHLEKRLERIRASRTAISSQS